MNSEVKNITKNKVLFTIDLLKGQGIPPRSGPAGIAIAVVTAIVPIIFVIMIFGFRSHDQVMMSIQQQEIITLEAKTDELSNAVESQRALEMQKIHYGSCISEVNASIDKYTQWSPVLTELIENMPGSVVLAELKVVRDSVEKEVPKPDDPKKKIKIMVEVNKLVLSVSDQGQGNCDEVVRNFRDSLGSSDLLGPMLAKIDVARRTENFEGKDKVFYEISCLFKTGL